MALGTFQFAGYTLDLARSNLTTVDREIKLRSKSFEVLRYLVENADRLVSKEELVKAIWPNAIVTDESLARCISDVRHALGDEQQIIIKTVPRRGYRFAAPVRRVPADAVAAPQLVPTPALYPMGALGITRQFDPPLPDRPSIAVLPFTNMSGDPEQDYLADGIVEDITTALSRFPSLFVIARNSAFTYKGRAVDIKQVGRELGVRYVVEGSVRKSGDKVRITGQLIQAETGVHVWADRYHGNLGDIFALQDEMTASIVGALVPNIQKAEIERARNKPPESLDAYDLYLRGLAAFFVWTPEGTDRALQFFEKTLIIDPDFIPAIIMMENCWGFRLVHGWPFLEAIAHSVRYARLAVKIDPENAEALAILARRTPWINRDYEQAIDLADRAVSINPNSAFVWIQAGFALMYGGQPERSLVHFERALRLSPRDPRAHDCLSGMAVALIQLARDTEAIAVANRAIQQNSNFTPAWRALSAALALSGHLDEARNAMSQVLELDPTCSISSMAHRVGYVQKARVRLFEGWRQAGMRE